MTNLARGASRRARGVGGLRDLRSRSGADGSRQAAQASWARPIALIALLLLSIPWGACRRDGKVGAECTSNRHCREGLRCLTFQSGKGACSQRCGEGTCPEGTVCKEIHLDVTKPGCNRSYTGVLEASYCVPTERLSEVEKDGRVKITIE